MAGLGTRLRHRLRKQALNNSNASCSRFASLNCGRAGFLFFRLSGKSHVAIYGHILLIAIAMAARYLTWANRNGDRRDAMQLMPEIEESRPWYQVCAKSGRFCLPNVLLPNVARSLLMFVVFGWRCCPLRNVTIPNHLSTGRGDLERFCHAIWG